MEKTFNQKITSAMLLGCNDLGILVLRLAVGGMMLTHGINKAMHYNTMVDQFPDPIGLGGSFSFLLVMLAESVGALLVMAGLITRLAALALVFNMAVAAFIAHAPVTFSGSELPLLYMVAFAVVAITGAGRYSLDSAIWGRALGNLA